MKIFLSFLALATLISCGPTSQPTPEAPISQTSLKEGDWRLVMASPGGDLAFTLKIQKEADTWKVTGFNGEEAVRFDKVSLRGDQFTFAIDHYESIFKGTVSADGSRLDGDWTKVVGSDKLSTLKFHADHGVTERYPVSAEGEPAALEGRWAVTFTHEDDKPEKAVAVFRREGQKLWGTFMTEVGDYRYLEGVVNGNEMVLSCFDGGHAFLFKAVLDEAGQLHGDFWSRDTWHETWMAELDDSVTQPDAFTMTTIQSPDKQLRFKFPDLEGKPVSHDDPMLEGKPRLVVIFGSWCPNCNDEAPFLEELYQTYKEKDLVVLGLAFELTGDAGRDTRVLKRFQKRHKTTYPILLAGVNDKKKAALKLPDLNHVRSYPTTLFINRKNEVVSIHTGFTGPGTGELFTELKAEFHEHIKEIL